MLGHFLSALVGVLLHAVHVKKDGDVLRVHIGSAASPVRLSFPLSDVAKQISDEVPAPARPFIPLVMHALGDAGQRHHDSQKKASNAD